MKFELTPQEVDLIGAALGKFPMEQVEPLVTKLREQFKAELEKAKDAEPA